MCCGRGTRAGRSRALGFLPSGKSLGIIIVLTRYRQRF